MLLAAAAVYVCCVYFTGDLINAVPALRPAEVATATAVEDGDVSPSKRKGKMHGIEVGRRKRWDGSMAIYSDHFPQRSRSHPKG